MTLARDVVVPGMVREYTDFSELLRGLSAEEWQAPSRCQGWTVADVGAHVCGTLTDVSALKLEGLGTPETTARQVDERRGQTGGQLADELDAAVKRTNDLIAAFDPEAWTQPGPQPNGKSLGHGVETLWYDTFVHADDIRTAIGRPSVNGPGAAASVSHLADALTDQEWGPATIRLDGLDEYLIRGGGDPVITGDAMNFILAATGRMAPQRVGLDETVNVYR
jgi:uncharacterized protein (TIGR03083 family)